MTDGLGDGVLDQGSLSTVELFPDDGIGYRQDEAVTGDMHRRDLSERALPHAIGHLAPKQVGSFEPNPVGGMTSIFEFGCSDRRIDASRHGHEHFHAVKANDAIA